MSAALADMNKEGNGSLLLMDVVFTVVSKHIGCSFSHMEEHVKHTAIELMAHFVDCLLARKSSRGLSQPRELEAGHESKEAAEALLATVRVCDIQPLLFPLASDVLNIETDLFQRVSDGLDSSSSSSAVNRTHCCDTTAESFRHILLSCPSGSILLLTALWLSVKLWCPRVYVLPLATLLGEISEGDLASEDSADGTFDDGWCQKGEYDALVRSIEIAEMILLRASDFCLTVKM